MQPPLSLHGEGVIPIRNEQRRICALLWLRGIKLCPGSEPHPGKRGQRSYYNPEAVSFCCQVLCRAPMGRAKSLPQGATRHVPTNIQSHFVVSVAVAWEKLKGNSDADTDKGGMPSADERTTHFTAPAAAAAAPSTIARSSSSLVSPLDSVVASQIEFMKHTLRSHTAHVIIQTPKCITEFLFSMCSLNRCSGCPKTATAPG
jgi:predicted Zn-ribbon and HTH transcriptional regulator